MGVGAGGAEDVVGYVGGALEVLEDVAGFCRGEVGRGWPVGVGCGVPEGDHEFAWLFGCPRVGAVVVDQVQLGVADGQRPGGFGQGELRWCGGGGGAEQCECGADGQCGEQESSHAPSVAGCTGRRPRGEPWWWPVGLGLRSPVAHRSGFRGRGEGVADVG